MTNPPPPTPPPPSPAGPSGLLLIDKPAGWTSMDVCARVRARLRRAGAPKRIKVGHAGTLDPFATGLLVVLVGKATRTCEAMMAQQKTYVTRVDLSCTSPTQDPEGEVTPVNIPAVPSRAAVQAALAAQVGTIMQVPPAFSAIHVGGRRAYDLARAGKPQDLPPRPVRIDEITLDAYEFPFADLTITCGKGTYIRSIARDLGLALGTGGMLRTLRRTRSGSFDVAHAKPLDTLPDMLVQDDLGPIPGV